MSLTAPQIASMPGHLANSAYPLFQGALRTVAYDPVRGNERFPARNMLLDEGVSPGRAAQYLQQAEPRVASKSWTELHGDFLREHIWLVRGTKALHGFDSIARCADTFSVEADFARYGPVSTALTLVRCEEPRVLLNIARKSGLIRLANEASLLDLLRAFLAKPTDQDLRVELQEVLDIYAEHADGRPIFAAFEEDLQEALADAAMWQDHLRNALGLAHIKQGSHMILLCYKISRIPLVPGAANTRALVVPAMLDNSLSLAFCPSPVQAATGHTLHLDPATFKPCREVLHPWIKWQVNDILRLGRVQTAPPTALDDARAFHLLALRELTGRSAYADDTDSDLLD